MRFQSPLMRFIEIHSVVGPLVRSMYSTNLMVSLMTVNFSLTIDRDVTSIYTPEGSLIDLQQNLMVFINDVLQVPGEAYFFDGGKHYYIQ